MRFALETLDQDQVSRRQTRQNLGQRRLLLLAHDGVAMPADHRHLRGAGGAVSERIAARLVDIDAVMGMLDRIDRPAAPHELGDQLLDQGRLAGILPAGDAEHPSMAHASLTKQSARCARKR